jgi:hypothetical protein
VAFRSDGSLLQPEGLIWNTDNASGTNLDCGNAASLRSSVNSVGTYLLLLRASTTANAARNILSHDGNGGAGHTGHELFKRGTDGSILRLTVMRATADLLLDSTTGNLVAHELAWWLFTWDLSTLANTKVFKAKYSNGRFADVTDAGTTSIGSGTNGTETGSLVFLSNRAALATAGWPGGLGWMQKFNRNITDINEANAMITALSPTWNGSVGCWVPSGRVAGSGRGFMDLSGNQNAAVFIGGPGLLQLPIARRRVFKAGAAATTRFRRSLTARTGSRAA